MDNAIAKCKYADKYMATQPPQCQCLACRDKYIEALTTEIQLLREFNEEIRIDELAIYKEMCARGKTMDIMRVCLGFFASVIKSGESWTDTCQQKYDEALKGSKEGADKVERQRVFLDKLQRKYNTVKGDLKKRIEEIKSLKYRLGDKDDIVAERDELNAEMAFAEVDIEKLQKELNTIKTTAEAHEKLAREVLKQITLDIGSGDDPITFILSSYAYVCGDRKIMVKQIKSLSLDMKEQQDIIEKLQDNK